MFSQFEQSPANPTFWLHTEEITVKTSRPNPVLQQDTSLLGQELSSTSYMLLPLPAFKSETGSVLSNSHVTFSGSGHFAICLNKSCNMLKPSPNLRLWRRTQATQHTSIATGGMQEAPTSRVAQVLGTSHPTSRQTALWVCLSNGTGSHFPSTFYQNDQKEENPLKKSPNRTFWPC